MHRPEIEPVPELFDIHVMAFADESATAVDALARIFGIERRDAQRLITDAPVVVKRAATPQVADALLDALGEIGAQVVLLPSSRKAPATPPAVSGPVEVSQAHRAEEPAEDGERDFFAIDPKPSDPAPPPSRAAHEAAGWGGLDLAASSPRLVAPRAELALDEEAHADVVPSAARRPIAPNALARSAPYASFAPPTATRHVAPRAELDDESSFGGLDDSEEREWDSGDSVRDEPQEPAVVDEPAQGGLGDSLELAVPLPTRRRQAIDPPPAPSHGPPPIGVGRRLGAPPSGPLPDLGLGLVPPLPALGSLPPLPPAAAIARGAGAARAATGVAARATQVRSPAPAQREERPRAAARGAAPTASAPRAGGAATGKADGPRAPLAPSLPQAAWMTRADVPSGPDLPRVGTFAGVAAGAAAAPAAPDAAPVQAQAATGFSPTDARAQARAAAASAAEALPRVGSRKSRMVAGLELIAGLAVFGFGLQLDNTVLHGNADTIWLVLHGFALYGIGSGLFGLRP